MLIAASFTDVNFALAFWTAVTFALLIVVLGKFAWRPILETLETRERTIADAIESARRARAEAEKAAADMRASLDKARAEASELIRRNQAEVAAAKTELIAAAKKESEALLAQARAPRVAAAIAAPFLGLAAIVPTTLAAMPADPGQTAGAIGGHYLRALFTGLASTQDWDFTAFNATTSGDRIRAFLRESNARAVTFAHRQNRAVICVVDRLFSAVVVRPPSWIAVSALAWVVVKAWISVELSAPICAVASAATCEAESFSCLCVAAWLSSPGPASAATSARQSRQLARWVSTRVTAVLASVPETNSLAALSSRCSTVVQRSKRGEPTS